MRKYFCLSSLLFCFLTAAFSSPVTIKYNGSGNYSLVERTNLRRYDNGKYTGLVSREVRSFISREKTYNDGLDFYYSGNFFVTEETRRNSEEVNDGIFKAIPSSFYISSTGKLEMENDNGYPSFRSFPSFVNKQLLPGDVWESEAVRAVDPLNKGVITHLPIYVQYTFVGEETYKGESVYKLTASWATRYGITYWNFGGDLELKSAVGSHKATILVSKSTGNAILVNDNVDETFIYKDGNKYQFKGTIILFTEYPPSIDKDKIIMSLQRVSLLDDESLDKKNDEINSSTNSKSDISKLDNKEKSNLAETDSGKRASTLNTTITSNSVKPIPETVDNINNDLKKERKISVEQTDSGLMLTIENLLFKPNSAELLAEETNRLDKIASVLKQVPLSMFLIEGHTAAIGTMEGEQELSEQRANKIAKELIIRGIPSEKIICKGSGRNKPVADNSTVEGRAKNRRVEITILE